MNKLKVLITLFLILFFFGNIACLQAQYASTDSLKEIVFLDRYGEIEIENVVFYQNPLYLEYKNITDDYTPEWYNAYSANGHFDYFKDYPNEAVKYFHSISGVTVEQLTKPLQIISEKHLSLHEIYPNPYEYIYGEIWFVYKKTKQNIVLVMGCVVENKLDNIEFDGDVSLTEGKQSNNPFKNRFNYEQPYIYEDNTLKRANQSYVFNEVLQSDKIIWKGTSFSEFTTLLANAKSYTRSRLENGQRIFETIKNTPDGPVVIKQGGVEKAPDNWFYNYWWALIAIVLFGLLIIVLKRKRS